MVGVLKMFDVFLCGDKRKMYLILNIKNISDLIPSMIHSSVSSLLIYLSPFTLDMLFKNVITIL